MGHIIDIPGGQKSEAWHAHRATHDNASDAPAMMGCSPYLSRSEFIKRQATGVTPEPDDRTAALYAEGHRSEALARPLAEAAIDDDLYPVIMAEGRMSASLDGHTLSGTIDLEHKLLNDRLRAVLPTEGIGGPEVGRALPLDYRVQIAHQHYCSGAEKTLFMASKWNADGELIEARYCWVERDEALIAQVVAGWAQFRKDVAEYKPAEVVAPVVANVMEHLPAVSVQTTGALVVKTNLDVFGEKLRAFVAKLPKEPETDQEFADLDAACKRLKDAEDAIERAVNGALASIGDVEAMRVTALQLAEIARAARLSSEKVVKTRKDEIKARELKKRADALALYITSAQIRLGGAYAINVTADFPAVAKGLRSLDSLRDKLDTALATAKIAVDAAEKRIAANLKTIADAGQDLQALFADRAALVQKDPEAVVSIVTARVNEHRAEEARREAARQAAEAERIAAAEQRAREQEAARIAAEQQRRAEEAAAAEAAAAAILKAQEVTPPAEVTAPVAPPPAAPEPSVRPVYTTAGFARTAPASAEVLTAPPAEEATIKLGDIAAKLGFSLPAAFILDTLGVAGKKGDRGAVLYTPTQVRQIKAALLKRIGEVL